MSDEPETVFPLSGGALQGWLRTAGAALFREFESGSQALDFLRSQGGSIRTQTFYDIRREVLELNKYQTQLEAGRSDNLVPMAYVNYEHGLKLAESFLYRIEISGTDPESKEPVTRWVSVYSQDQLTKGEVLGRAESLVLGLEEFYGVVPEEFSLRQVLGRTEADEEAFFGEFE